MAGLHYKKGSSFPPLQEGVQRCYSMKFCPYAQRTRMALAYKKVPHEIININLKKRPDWFSERTPVGAVPVLEKDGKIVYDSLICNYYLDEVYPENKLMPDDPFEKARISMLMELFPRVTAAFFGIFMNYEDETKCAENVEKFISALKPFEDAVTGLFFGGASLGMLDLFIWPFFERIGVVNETIKKPIVSAESFPKLTKWREVMMETDLVKSVMYSTDVHMKYFQTHMNPDADYDSIVVD